MTATEDRLDLTVPVRECAPWCNVTLGHDEHEHPVDRCCYSAVQSVPMTLRKPVKMCDDIWWYDRLDLVVRRPNDSDVPVVVLNHEGDPEAFNDPSFEFELTLSEARVLRDALDRQIRIAENG